MVAKLHSSKKMCTIRDTKCCDTCHVKILSEPYFKVNGKPRCITCWPEAVELLTEGREDVIDTIHDVEYMQAKMRNIHANMKLLARIDWCQKNGYSENDPEVSYNIVVGNEPSPFSVL